MSAIESYLNSLPYLQQSVVKRLNQFILNLDPRIEVRFAYNIPFYYFLGRFCYINPRKHEVDLGFVRGSELGNSYSILEARGRSEVRTASFSRVDDIPWDALRESLMEAMLLNEKVPYGRIGKVA